MAERRPPVGPERLLALLYGVFVVAAGSRSAVQLSLHAGDAPLAYSLSVLAAIVYAVGFALVTCAARGRALRAAAAWCGVELAGVVSVGAASVLAPDAFPDATVWSRFGSGYLFVPVALPVAALLWLRGLRARRPQEALEASSG